MVAYIPLRTGLPHYEISNREWTPMDANFGKHARFAANPTRALIPKFSLVWFPFASIRVHSRFPKI
jgi:hypothetical protein